MVPPSSTTRPGMNFRVAGLGVASVWMNMVFSGVAGSRPAHWVPLADGDGGCTIKGRRAPMTVVPAKAGTPTPCPHYWPTVVFTDLTPTTENETTLRDYGSLLSQGRR